MRYRAIRRPAASPHTPATDVPRCKDCKRIGVRAGELVYQGRRYTYACCRWCHEDYPAAERAVVAQIEQRRQAAHKRAAMRSRRRR